MQFVFIHHWKLRFKNSVLILWECHEILWIKLKFITVDPPSSAEANETWGNIYGQKYFFFVTAKISCRQQQTLSRDLLKKIEVCLYHGWSVKGPRRGKDRRQYYTLVEQKAILLIFISIVDKNINFRSKWNWRKGQFELIKISIDSSIYSRICLYLDIEKNINWSQSQSN